MINSTDKIIVVDTSAKATPINVSILIMLTKTHLKVFWTFQQWTYLNSLSILNSLNKWIGI